MSIEFDEPTVLADLSLDSNHETPNLTVVVPTRNEKHSIELLLARLGPAVAPLGAELIFVDDSDDETPGVLAEQAGACPVPIRILHRPPGSRKGGLSSAVIAGARHARGDWVLVMDADLQHPPEAAAVVASTAMRHDCDIVVGTRYSSHRSAADGLDSAGRVFVSSFSTRLVKNLFPRRLAMVSDPLSGLFAFRRTSVNLDRLKPAGFKVLLEILVRNPVARVAEVAYRFEPRAAGDSKASLRQGVTFLQHVVKLRAARLARQLRERPVTRSERISQAVRFVSFGLIGATGIVVNSAALWFFYHTLGWNHLVGASLATQVSTTWNFLLVDMIVYRNRAQGTHLGRAVRFFLMNNVLLLARLPVFQFLIDRGLDVLIANGITLVLLFFVRFVLSDRAIFASAGRETRRDPVRVLVDLTTPDGDGLDDAASAARKRSRYLTYRYDVAGVVKIGSQIMLPELEFFRAQHIADSDVDIAVRVGDVGNKRPCRRAAMIESSHPTVIRYEEHLGRLGANFRARIDDRITVEVGPLLARSSHVVYTNILEPLLRFVMVSRGRMLLHSACVELAGTGVMLSALTDTGKTGTVLRLLREHGGRFLSDDMTVIDRSGNASWFPKPLTISAHTLRAVSAEDLTRSEWRRLQIQSRLHSKGGRSIGMALSRFNLPIMGINALTQMLIPPPKYTVDRLVPCQMTDATRVRELFIIERGSPRLADLDKSDALTQLLANTDDAYGFPPFRYLAPAICIGSQNYHELRAAERDILAGFLANVRVRTLASDSFSWADEIPHLIRPSDSGTTDASGHGASDRFSWSEESSRLTGASDSGAMGNGSAASHARSDAGPGWGNGAAYHLNGAQPRDGVSGIGNGTGPAPSSVVATADTRSGNGSGPASGTVVATAENGTGDGSGLAPSLVVAPPHAPTHVTEPPLPSFPGRLLYPGLPLAVIMALAAFLRFWHLNAIGFNSDEAVYAGQAASIAGDPQLSKLFPVFRAHPLLFQMATSLTYQFHVSDLAPRLLAVAFGLATVAVGYAAGARIYGRQAGLIAALLLAAMPYLVVVNRQALLDGPMAFFTVLALWLLARLADEERPGMLYGAGAALGLAFISKETAIVLIPAAYAFLALTPGVRVRLKDLWIFFGCIAVVALPYPVSLLVAGGSRSGQHFLTWQLFRPPNHIWTFYATVVPPALGIPVVLCGAGALIAAASGRRWSWRESLLACWIAVPLFFFQLWPVKGFQYLLPIAAPCAILTAGLLSSPQLAQWLGRARVRAGRVISLTVTAFVACWLVVVCWMSIHTANSTSFLAGTGGVPGGRQAGHWIASHTPRGAEMLAIGPSMANILEFYGDRQLLGLAVSPNPLHRNPVYTPVKNPDLLLRTGQVQYLVWDAYSAGRSSFFSQRLLLYVRRYQGNIVHTESVSVSTPGGTVQRPVIVIYEVRP